MTRPSPLQLVALANPLPDDDGVDALVPSDWSDALLARILAEPAPTTAGRRRVARPLGRRLPRRRWLALAAVVALGVLAAAPALGLHRRIIDFLESEPAPARVQMEFGQMEAGSPGGLGPGVLPGEARKVMEAELQGKRRVLWVAPTKSGGFCWTWPDLLVGCSRREAALWVVRLETKDQPGLIGGHVLEKATVRLELRYEDGRVAEIPFIWISAPIDAGLFVFEVPREHLRPGHRAQALVALSAAGEEVARYGFLYSDPAWEPAADGLPKIADRSRKRTLIDIEGASGRRWTLTVAPAPGNRLCYTYDVGGGCLSLHSPRRNLSVGLQNTGATVIVFGTVGESIASVELRFDDGTRTRVEPVEGFVLWEITAARYPPGRRLRAIVGYGTEGREVARQDVQERAGGIYPCVDPVNRGYDVEICR